MALAVPLSRFTSRVGGGSAFFVRPQHRTIMRGFIQDIINDPHEYLPMLLMLGGLFLLLGCLCLCGYFSLRASTPPRRFWFSLAPILFGLIGVWAQIPISLERDSFHLHFDFGWLFLVPLLLGGAGFISYWRARHEPVA